MRLLMIATAVLACLPAVAQEPTGPTEYSAVGKASFYSSRFHGRATARGVGYDQTADRESVVEGKRGDLGGRRVI